MTRHLAIVGPTAAGKSALAFAITARSDDVEIVSLDSMQVYREMDIGTAKPTAEERTAVPHHGIDVADPSEEWSVRATQELVRDALTDIETRGRRALLVGGTGLYVRAVVDALDVPATDPAVRAAIDARAGTPAGLADAYDDLRVRDPVAAARVEPGNRRRIVRALEVIELTGRPFSSFGPGLATYGPPAIDVTLIGVTCDDLAARIARRFTEMRDAGLLEEVRALHDRPSGLSRTASHAIGYKELLEYLDNPSGSPDVAFDAAITRTRQFARRQRVWFRRDPRITWVNGNSPATVDAVVARWEAPVPDPVNVT